MPPESDPYKYDVFISYSRKNETFAGKLEQALESYWPEKHLNVPKRHIETFRDKEDFSSGDYHRNLLINLSESSKLIVVCSPEARASQFVNDEIKRFVEVRGAEHIIPLLLSGIPNNEAVRGREDDMAFPDELCSAQEMPLAINYLNFDPQKDKINKGIFVSPWYNILADIYSLGRSEMEQRERKRRSRRRRLAFAVMGGGLAILSVLLIFAMASRKQALTAQKKANDSLTAAYTENGRQELINSYPFHAAGYLNAAYQVFENNESTTDPSTLLLLLKESMKTLDSLQISLPHTDVVTSGAFSPDGKRVVTSSYMTLSDNTTKVWDAESGDLLNTLDEKGVRVSPDGKKILALGNEGTAEIRDSVTGEVFTRLENSNFPTSSAIFSTDGERVMVGTEDSDKIWNVETGRLVTAFEHKGAGKAVGYSSDWSRVVTASGDGYARVWDIKTGKLLTLLKSTDRVKSATLSTDNKEILTVAEKDKTVRVWNTNSGKKLNSLVHQDIVKSASFSRNGQKIITSSEDRSVKIWNVGSDEAILSLPQQRGVTTTDFSPDGKMVVTGGFDKTAKVWDAATGNLLGILEHQDTINSAGFSPDSKKLITSSSDNTAKIWNLEKLKPQTSFEYDSPPVRSVFSPDGHKLATLNGQNIGTIWDGKTGQPIVSFGHDLPLRLLKFSPDGTRIVTASDDSPTEIWDAETGALVTSIEHKNYVELADFSPDDRFLLTARGAKEIELSNMDGVFTSSGDNSVDVWDTTTGKLINSAEMKTPVSWIQASPDSSKFSVASYNDCPTIRDIMSGEILQTVDREGTEKAEFSPNGKLIASMDNYGRSVRVWDVETGRHQLSLEHPDRVDTAGFSNDGRRVVTTTDQAIRVWEVETGNLVVSFSNKSRILSISFSPDGKKILTSHQDTTTKLWDIETGKPILEFRNSSRVKSVQFSSDGTKILAISDDNTATVWDIVSEIRSAKEINEIVETKLPFHLVNGILVSR